MIRPQPFQHLYRRHAISTRLDDFHVSGIPETRKRRLSQTWVCCNLHESRQGGDHAAHLDGVFEAVAVQVVQTVQCLAGVQKFQRSRFKVRLTQRGTCTF